MGARSGGKVDEDRVHGSESGGAYVFGDADQLAGTLEVCHAHAFADGIFAGPEFARCGLADDDDVLVRTVFAGVEGTAAHDGNAEELEVVGGDLGVRDLVLV